MVIGNGLGTIPLHVLTTRAKLTPKSDELGFENEVQDILRCQTRPAKINCPSVVFVRSRLGEKKKNLLKGKFAVEPTVHHY